MGELLGGLPAVPALENISPAHSPSRDRSHSTWTNSCPVLILNHFPVWRVCHLIGQARSHAPPLEVELIPNCTNGSGVLLCFFIGFSYQKIGARRVKTPNRFTLKMAAAAAAAKSLQSCPTLCDPIDGSPPGSLIPGILQARTLEWAAISFSNA